jgi:hypothetical protein
MREIRTSGSEGGGAGNSTSPSYAIERIVAFHWLLRDHYLYFVEMQHDVDAACIKNGMDYASRSYDCF